MTEIQSRIKADIIRAVQVVRGPKGEPGADGEPGKGVALESAAPMFTLKIDESEDDFSWVPEYLPEEQIVEEHGVAIGISAHAKYGFATGVWARAEGGYPMADPETGGIGVFSDGQSWATAINGSADGQGATAIGGWSQANGEGATAIGDGAIADFQALQARVTELENTILELKNRIRNGEHDEQP